MAAEDHGEGLNQTAQALDSLTNTGAFNQEDDPKSHIHSPANSQQSRSWLGSWVTPERVDKVQHFFNDWHMGNYVIDRATGEKSFEAMSIYVRLGMHTLYYGTRQGEVLHWKRTEELLMQQSIKMGKAYDSPESKTHIEPFIASFGLQESLKEMVEPDPSKYPTFNEFFAREIREDARPIAEPNNDLVVSSPADCRLTAFQTVDLATKYWIKGFGFSVANLLDDTELAQTFEGGSIVIARLAPQDYHRWHSPVSGVVESVKDIPGQYYTVNPQAICQEGILDVFCENRRSVQIIRRMTGAPVAIVAVGAMLVGSIVYVNDADKAGAHVRRGQCLGKFLYGGSTVIVLFPKGEIAVDEDLAKNSTELACETLLKVGQRIGVKPSA